MKSFKTG